MILNQYLPNEQLYSSFEDREKFDDLEFIDFGSGFKVPYKEGDIETDIEELGKKMGERFNQSRTGRAIWSGGGHQS